MRPEANEFRLPLGIIGAGRAGQAWLEAFATQPAVQLAAVADWDLETAEMVAARYPGLALCADWRGLAEHPHLQALVVAAPVAVRSQMVRACLAAGKHVLVEGPLARCGREANRLVEQARHSGLTLAVAHGLVTHPAAQYLRALLQSGGLGQLRHIRIDRCAPVPRKREPGALWGLGSRDVALLCHWFGVEVEEVSTVGSTGGASAGEDLVCCLMRFPGDLVVNLQFSWGPRLHSRWVLTGTRRIAEFEEYAPGEKLRIQNVSALSGGPAGGEESWSPELAPPRPHASLASLFLDAVRTGAPLVSDGAFGARVVELLESIHRARPSQPTGIGELAGGPPIPLPEGGTVGEPSVL